MYFPIVAALIFGFVGLLIWTTLSYIMWPCVNSLFAKGPRWSGIYGCQTEPRLAALQNVAGGCWRTAVHGAHMHRSHLANPDRYDSTLCKQTYTKIGALESSKITDIRVSDIATPEETRFMLILSTACRQWRPAHLRCDIIINYYTLMVIWFYMLNMAPAKILVPRLAYSCFHYTNQKCRFIFWLWGNLSTFILLCLFDIWALKRKRVLLLLLTRSFSRSLIRTSEGERKTEHQCL